MKKFINSGLFFVKNNPTIIYSLLLIFVVIAALFLNSYFVVTRFQDNLDKTLRGKAVLAEDVMSVAAAEYFSDISQNKNILAEKISQIQKNDGEIVELSLYDSSMVDNKYQPIISSKSDADQQALGIDDDKISQNSIKFALSVNDAFAYVSNVNGNRFWSVVKAIRSSNGSVEGVLLLKLSLAQNDALVAKTIFQTYLLSIGAMLIVLLLILNHIRLFRFELRAKKLEEIDRMKDDFLSMASHELKSPLTAIIGYAELLGDTLEEEKILSDGKMVQKKYLKNISNSVGRLNTLIEDLLNVSRIEQNRLPVSLVETDLSQITADIIDEMSILANEKDLEIKKDISCKAKISADPERLKQIIVNLISNAIKYTPKGSVEIKIKEEGDNVLLIVSDTGLGMSAENMKNLFSKFYRVKTADTAGISGTGLGLWIAKEIAQKMSGDLRAESVEGVGSSFTLVLKKAVNNKA